MSNKEQYRKICKEKPGIPVFMQPWWLDVVCDAWEVAIARKGEEISGIWAYPVENKMGVSLIRNPLLTPYLGPHVFYPADLKQSRADAFEYETVSELIKQLPACKVWHLAVSPGIKQAGICKQHNLRVEVQQTFLINLAQTEAALLANIKDTARRNIKQSAQEEVVLSDNNALQQLYQFQLNTLTGKGREIYYKAEDLQKILDACTAHNAGELLVAKNGENIQAIVWNVWDDNRSYYFMGGQNPEANGYKAMSLLLWTCIKNSKKRGQKLFDLEGSMDEGVERFFRTLGGDRELYMVLQKNDALLWKIKKSLLG